MNPNKALWEKGAVALFTAQNTSPNGHTTIPATFMRVMVTV